ncbi:hypothetical protein PHYC_02238 [Phycisphaerales bacterium]|nr:hypothetical protein PHYC_02238 [Phycisphaerales bacterium]
MRMPAIQGLIARRVLVNFRVRPEAIRAILPPVFRPQLVDGWSVAGICLIRLERIRPRWMPVFGIASENAAHRIAVEWDGAAGVERGVFIPRRDTSSWVNSAAGGRLFPGEHHRATFKVRDRREKLSLEFASADGNASVSLVAHRADFVATGSMFKCLADASAFFRGGAVGYSVKAAPGRLDGVELRCRDWEMWPLAVEHVRSSFFEDLSRFAPGDVEFDSAFIMRRVRHEWVGRPEMCCGETAGVA